MGRYGADVRPVDMGRTCAPLSVRLRLEAGEIWGDMGEIWGRYGGDMGEMHLGLEAAHVEGRVEGVGEGDVQVLVQRGAYRRVGRG